MRTAARSRSATGKDRAEFASGLMIGKDHSVVTVGILDGVYYLKSFFCIIVYRTRMFMALCYYAGATEEQAASKMKKEQYRQELLKQIAEQQRNKIRYLFTRSILD